MSLESAGEVANLKIRRTSDGRILRTIYAPQIFRSDMSDDGQVIAAEVSTDSQPYNLAVFLANTGQMQWHHALQTYSYYVALSPKGDLVASYGDSGLSICRVSDGSLQAVVNDAYLQINAPFVFTPDGNRIVHTNGNHVTVIDTSNGNVLAKWDALSNKSWYAHFGFYGAPAVSPDGTKVALLGLPTTGYVNYWSNGIFDLVTGQMIDEWVGGPGEELDTIWAGRAWRKNGIYTLLRRWDDLPYQIVRQNPTDGSRVQITGVPCIIGGAELSVSTDGRFAATGGYRNSQPYGILGVLGLSDVLSGELIDLGDHAGPVQTTEFSPDGFEVATGSADMTIKFWDRETGSFKRQFNLVQPVMRIAYSTSGSAMAVVYGSPGGLRISISDVISAADGSLLHRFDCPDSWGYVDAAFSPDGRRLYLLSYTYLVAYDSTNWNELARVSVGFVGGGLALSPDGNLVIVAGQFFRAQDLSYIPRNLPNFPGALDVAFSADGSTVVVAGVGTQVTAYNTSDWSVRWTVEGISNYPVRGMAIDPSGKFVCYAIGNQSGSVDAKLRIVRLSDGYIAKEYDQEICPWAYGTLQIRYAPDGRSFAYTRWDSAIVVAQNPFAASPNAPPTAKDHGIIGVEDYTTSNTGLLDGATDPDGDPLTTQLVSGPTSGTVDVKTDGSFTYTPNKDFNGNDTFTYKALDGKGGESVPATVTIDVTPVNDPPSFTKGADQTVPEDAGAQTVSAWATDISAGPANESGQKLDFRVDSNNHALFSAQPAIAPDGTLTYAPAPDANGIATVTVYLHDSGGTEYGGPGGYGAADVSPSVTFTITVSSVNDAPVARSEAYTTNEDAPLTVAAPGLLANDTDVDGDTLSATVVTTTTYGKLSLNADGSFTYTPQKDYNGSDSLTYKVSDGKGGGSTAVTVNLTVSPVNDPPVATLDTAPVEYETTTKIVVLTNDIDIDGDSIRVISVAKPLIGSVVLDSGGNVVYTPRSGFSGADVFTYTISDPSGATSSADVRITVNTKNKPPVAGRDTVETSPGLPVEIDVLANDTDPDGDSLSIWTFDQPAKGTVVRLANGHFLYTPGPDFKHGHDTFTYTLVDARGATDVGRVAISIR